LPELRAAKPGDSSMSFGSPSSHHSYARQQSSPAHFYVGVPDVEAALRRAERLGGTRRMGPDRAPGRDLVVAHFTDPEGNLIGLAGPS
jgi:predicted enzyme related to lactoylglutathione lyase